MLCMLFKPSDAEDKSCCFLFVGVYVCIVIVTVEIYVVWPVNNLKFWICPPMEKSLDTLVLTTPPPIAASPSTHTHQHKAAGFLLPYVCVWKYQKVMSKLLHSQKCYYIIRISNCPQQLTFKLLRPLLSGCIKLLLQPLGQLRGITKFCCHWIQSLNASLAIS